MNGLLMKTKSNLLAMFLGALLLALPDVVNAQFTYTTNNDGSLNLSLYTGPGGAVAIPATTNGRPVTSIGAYAFLDYFDLTSVTIPNSVTNIAVYAFYDCASLTAITVNINNPAYSSLAGVLFNQNQTTLILFPMGVAGTYTIPDRVTSIGEAAFFDCGSLTSVTIGTNVTCLGDFAFGNCISLASVTLPNSVTNIGAYAFGDCGLTRVTIPNSVTSIGEEAFGICSSLTNVTISTNLTSISDYAFEFCGLTSVTIPNSVTNIGSYAFYHCDRLWGIYFQGNAPSLGSSVFYADNDATVYDLPGTTGWATFDANSGLNPAVLWNPQAQTGDTSFGMKHNQFGFNITGSSDLVVVVEACTNLAHPVWCPVATNTLTGGSSYFSDSECTNYPGRFYRLRSP